MLFRTFTSVFLAAISWDNAVSAELTTPALEAKSNCTPGNKACERVAVANIVGSHGVAGYFKFISPPNVDDVKIMLRITSLGTYPGTPGQSFSYHIHTDPVGEGNNCTSTKGHLNPLHVPETVVCNPEKLETCQYGDLSGKHGTLSAPGNSTVTRSYVDTQLRFAPPEDSMVGRSVVIHDAQKNRIACGNVIFDYAKK